MSLEGLCKRCTDFLSPTELRPEEILAPYTTFKVGGPADLLVCPTGEHGVANCLKVLEIARQEGIETTILGGGSNVLVSDSGVRGLVLVTTGCNGIRIAASPQTPYSARVDSPTYLSVDCGASIDQVARYCEDNGLSGFEFIAGMPGTVGGAVWMNARCYGRSISDLLVETRLLDENGHQTVQAFAANEFDYKQSPFQLQKSLILSVLFELTHGQQEAVRTAGDANRQDREQKGHYRQASAGSTFKNNHLWGKPTGRIIDELGLRGLTLGGAMVAPWHGNILVNTGAATAAEIRALVEDVQKRVYEALDIMLEPEILFIGDWS